MEAALVEYGITNDPNMVGKSVDNVTGEESVDVKADEGKEESQENGEKEENEGKEEIQEVEDKSK